MRQKYRKCGRDDVAKINDDEEGMKDNLTAADCCEKGQNRPRCYYLEFQGHQSKTERERRKGRMKRCDMETRVEKVHARGRFKLQEKRIRKQWTAKEKEGQGTQVNERQSERKKCRMRKRRGGLILSSISLSILSCEL